VIIAVNLNAQLVGRHLSRAGREEVALEVQTKQDRNLWRRMLESLSSADADNPSVFDVVSASVNILQDRLTRSRMAGDPPEITLLPVLEDFAMMDFHRAQECIDEGRRLVKEHEATLKALANP
jgi:NTE family protein